jgi:hypothetical protein
MTNASDANLTPNVCLGTKILEAGIKAGHSSTSRPISILDAIHDNCVFSLQSKRGGTPLAAVGSIVAKSVAIGALVGLTGFRFCLGFSSRSIFGGVYLKRGISPLFARRCGPLAIHF